MEPPENQIEILEQYKQGPRILNDALAGLKDSDMDYVPEGGGWTIRQIIHHIADGDDIWKTGIRIALGGEQGEFNLDWYRTLPQTEWAKRWKYESRPVEISLALLKANRDYIIQLLESAGDGWSKSVRFRDADGKIELVLVGFVIKMQSDHLVHHVKRIAAIRNEAVNPLDASNNGG